jgi:23S rRNA (guanosine2251-2'-O)-methyltransferase
VAEEQEMKPTYHAFGLHAAQGMLRNSPQDILELLVQDERHDSRVEEILREAGRHGLAVRRVPRKTLDKLSEGGNHQGVALLCRGHGAKDQHDLDELLDNLRETPFLLVLDGVQDPHNLGACLRTADAAGVHAVIVPKDRASGLSPTVRKVACGAVESVPLVQVTNLARTLEQLKQRGIWLIGLAGEAESGIFQTGLSGPLALVLGAEEKGLRRLTRENCDVLAHIPMRGQVESLNVSVAAGICLYEALRQRGG